MKKLRVLLVALAAIATQLASADVQRLTIDGNQMGSVLQLTSSEHHTLYRDIPVASTCYRTEQQGWDNICVATSRTVCTPTTRRECTPGTAAPVCSMVEDCNGPRGNPATVCRTHSSCTGGGAEVCRDVPDSVCRQIPDSVCHQEPRIVTIAYGCTKIETVAVGEQTDYNVKASVAVNIIPSALNTTAPNEVLAVTLEGSDVSLRLESSSNSMLVVSKQTSNAVSVLIPEQGTRAGLKQVDSTYDISLIPVAAVTSPAVGGINDMTFNGDSVVFTVGKVTMPELLRGKLKIKRNRRFWVGVEIVDVDLNQSNVSLRDLGERTEVTVAIAGMTSEAIQKAEYAVEAKITASGDLPGVLNPNLVPENTEASANIKVKINR